MDNSIPLLRNSERTDFRRCPQRWHWRYQKHLVPIELNTGPLVFGTFGHLALAEWYIPGNKRGPHPAETWDKITQEFFDVIRCETTGFVDEDVEVTWEDARDLGHEILLNYVNEYGRDEHWEVLWTEHPFIQNIPNPREIAAITKNGSADQKQKATRAIVKYVGTLDLIVRDHLVGGRIRYVDHKFMKAIQTNHLTLDSQNGGYLAIGTHQLRQLGLLAPKESVRDLVYNFVRKARFPDKDRNALGEWLNKDGSISKRQPSPFFVRHVVTKTAAERNSQIVHIGDEALAMKAFRTGKLPIYKNPTKDCSWDCQFFSLCNVDESKGDVETTMKVLFKKEDPYTEYKNTDLSTKKLSKKEQLDLRMAE